MRQAIVGLLASALLFALLAGFSGAARVEDKVRVLKDRWAAIQSLPEADARLQLIETLRYRADALAQRYPANETVSRWSEVIDRTEDALRRRRRDSASHG